MEPPEPVLWKEQKQGKLFQSSTHSVYQQKGLFLLLMICLLLADFADIVMYWCVYVLQSIKADFIYQHIALVSLHTDPRQQVISVKVKIQVQVLLTSPYSRLDIASLSRPVWESVGLMQLPCILAVIDHTTFTYKNINQYSPKFFLQKIIFQQTVKIRSIRERDRFCP